MSFKEALQTKSFVITVEIAPPKGTDIAAAVKEAHETGKCVDGINVTDNQRAIMRLSPISLCHKLVQAGFSPILQITCRDRNRIALQADLLSASVLGIENILILTGDAISSGDHPDAKEVFDLDSVSLLEITRKLCEGTDMHGRALTGAPQFFLGAAVNPGAEPKELQVIQMRKKIEAGAEFFQTQLIFDVEDFKLFLSMASHLPLQKIKIIAGIFPLKSAKQARFLNDKVPGVKIPEKIIQRLEKAKDQVQEGIEIAWEIVQQLKGCSAGVHLMSMGNRETLLKLVEKLKYLK